MNKNTTTIYILSLIMAFFVGLLALALFFKFITPIFSERPVPTEPEPTAEQREVLVYFGHESIDPMKVCETVLPVKRSVPDVPGIAREALEELFNGPTVVEVEQGYLTSIPDGVKIQSLTIENGTAFLDASEDLERGAGGSCRVVAIRTQIKETLLQFSTVQDVVLSINGRTEDILQP